MEEKLEIDKIIVLRLDDELPLGGLYVDLKTEKFKLEKKVDFKKFKIFLCCILLSSNLSISPAKAKSLNYQQSTVSIIQNFQKSEKIIEEKKSKTFNAQKKVTEIQEFDPFDAEIKEQMQKNEKFVLELEEFKEKKISNEKNFSFKTNNNNIGILVKRNPIVLVGNNDVDPKFSKQEKEFFTTKFRAIVSFVQHNKVLIFSFFFGCFVIVIYFVLKANKILFLEKTNEIFELQFKKFTDVRERLKTLVNSGQNFSSEIPKEISSLDIDNSQDSNSNLEIPEEISSLDIKNSSNSDLEIIEEENIIFPDTTENSFNNLERIRTCIEHGKILKSEELLFNQDMENIQKVKEYFLEYGDDISANHEDWMDVAIGIKAEMDKLLQSRIEWEKALNAYLETCH